MHATAAVSAPASCRSSRTTCSSTDGRTSWLIPTAEVPLTNLVAGRDPRRGGAAAALRRYTPCFRAEAGAAGKDTRGMIRQHQFHKVELVSIATPEQSDGRARAHDRLRRGDAEAARAALPRRCCCAPATWASRAQDLRHRGLAARAGRLPRDLAPARTAATSRRGA